MSDEMTYPHKDGDVTVLGPQIFVGYLPNGRPVINWKGENFEPQRLTVRAWWNNKVRVPFVEARRRLARV